MHPRLALGGAIALLAALVPFYAISWWAPATGMMHDDGVYLATAKALAEGKGYRIVSLPQEIPQTKYPVLFPAVLSLVWRLDPSFPGNLVLLRLVPFCAALVWFSLSYRLLRSWGSVPRSAALVLLFLAAGTPWVVFLSTAMMSDLLFAALATGTILLLLRVEREDVPNWPRILAAGMVAAAAFHTRTAGLAAVIAGGAGLWLAGKRKPALVFLAVSLALCAPWLVWQWQQVRSETSVEAYYTAENYRDWNVLLGRYSIVDRLSIFMMNLLWIATEPVRAFGILNLVNLSSAVTLGAGLGLWLPFLVGVTRTPALRMLHLYALASIGLYALWAWHPGRFLVSLLPVVLLVSYWGVRRRFAKCALLVILAIPMLVLAVRIGRNSVANGVAWFTDRGTVDFAKVSAVHDWLRLNAAKGSVVLANYDAAVYLWTGHRSIRPFVVDGRHWFYLGTGSFQKKLWEMNRVIEKSGARYLTETGKDDVEEPDFARLLEALDKAGRIRLVKEIAPKYRIFELL
jgi:hypothetical protein